MDPMNLPPVNAALNAMCAVLLLCGFVFIKRGRRRAHAACMIGALVTSVVFLACYLTYHYLLAGHVTRFPEEYPTARVIYFLILGTHTILAVVNLPMVVLTVIPAVRGNFERHRRMARWTWPIWMYVSVTGVLVYLSLYVIWPAH